MSEPRIKTIEFDEFQTLADEFIERSSQGYGEMQASAFFDLLFEKMAERVTKTIELEGEVVDAQLVLRVPLNAESTVQVRNNEILVGNWRIVVKLKADKDYPTIR